MIILAASDIHANPFPLREILKTEKFDVSIFLGDLVDYGPYPAETIDLVRQNFDIVVQGNHDFAAANNADCLCGQENHELSVYTRENLTMPMLAKSDLQYLKSLEPSVTREFDGMSFDLSHGSPSNRLYGYMYPWKISSDFLKNEIGRQTDANIVMVGHTHYQFYVPFQGEIILNPGSVGQPRDGPYPSYMLIDTDRMQFTMKRIRYDCSEIRNRIISLVKDKRMLDQDLKLFRFS
ncbi:MAG: metallophosphoesterase family protein [Thermoplasmata archaeon]